MRGPRMAYQDLNHATSKVTVYTALHPCTVPRFEPVHSYNSYSFGGTWKWASSDAAEALCRELVFTLFSFVHFQNPFEKAKSKGY